LDKPNWVESLSGGEILLADLSDIVSVYKIK